MLVVLYVDDMLIAGRDEAACDGIIQGLRERFEEVTVKSGKEISFLGLEIRLRDDGAICVTQETYVRDVVKGSGVTGTEKLPATDAMMALVDDGDACDRDKYRSLIMKLLYVAVRTRPDILYVVSVLAGRMESATMKDMGYVEKVLRYLSGSATEGLMFLSGVEWCLHMSVDASFNHHRDGKGHSGYVVYASKGSAGVLFKSQKQKAVADSSTEAELIALHEAVKHLIWISNIYSEMGYKSVESIQIQQDNQACIRLSSEVPVNFRGRSRFINRKYFGVYEYVQCGDVELQYIATDSMVSDFLTKALGGEKYRRFKIQLMGSCQE